MSYSINNIPLLRLLKQKSIMCDICIKNMHKPKNCELTDCEYFNRLEEEKKNELFD